MEGVEGTYQHVLLVSGAVADARDVVVAVEAMGKGVGKPGHMGRPSALVLVPPAAKEDTLVGGASLNGHHSGRPSGGGADVGRAVAPVWTASMPPCRMWAGVVH